MAKHECRLTAEGVTSPAAAAGSRKMQDEPCVELLHRAASHEPGIIHVDLDPRHETVSIAYNPDVIAEADVARVARDVAPAIHDRLGRCTMRLEHQGGRSCESCALVLENRLKQIPGVHKASASYMGGVLSVSYDRAMLTPDALVQKVRELRVPVAPPVRATPTIAEEAATAPAEVRLIARARAWLTQDRLEAVLMVTTFVAMMLGLLAENAWHNEVATAILYTVAYVAGGAFGLRAGVQALMQATIDVDLLMVLAALGAAFVGAPFEGAMLLFLFSLSNVLQAYALDRTRNAIRALMKLRPKHATVRRGSGTEVVPIERVVVGDVILVKPGERVAMDGMVSAGESTVDQSSITGESIPVGKHPGDTVYAGTINKNGSLDVTVTKRAEDSTIAQLIKLVEEAHSEKAKTQRFIDKFEQIYAAVVIGATILAVVIPIAVFSEAFDPAFYRAMTIMVAASPCALVISTPASILSAIGNGARRGVLFKGGVHLEQAMTIKAVAFDKTGTLTEGKPRVTDVEIVDHPARVWQGTADDLLAVASSVQSKSEHSLARATLAAAAERNIQVSEAFAFQATTGKGVRGVVGGQDVRIGNLRYFEGMDCAGMDEAQTAVSRLELEGKTCVAVAEVDEANGCATMLGVIAFADTLRPDVAAVVRDIRAAGVQHVVMLTGDNRRVAEAIAKQAGLDDFYAELLPEEKVTAIKDITQKYGPTAMVGDGVNDAPALATARLGIAMGAAGTDVALETADVVLMGDDLSNIPYVIALSRQTRKTLITNIGFALFMIGLMIAAIFAVNLPLPLAVVGHEGGTVLVSLNGLRLLAYRRRKAAAGRA